MSSTKLCTLTRALLIFPLLITYSLLFSDKNDMLKTSIKMVFMMMTEKEIVDSLPEPIGKLQNVISTVSTVI